MSKLPMPPFGDKVIQKPPVLRFKGIRDDAPEAVELARAFGPQIRQFYLKAAQQHALGITDLSKRQMQIGDGLRAQYSNVQGQEIVTVEVAAGKRGEVKQQSEIFWDWGLIDITALAVAYTYVSPSIFEGVRYPYLIAGARLRNPRSDSVGPVASSGSIPTESDDTPVLHMAQSGVPDFEASELQQSLLVDMRGMGNIPQVQIELFAKLSEMPDDTTQVIVGKYFAARIDVSYASQQTPNYFDNPGNNNFLNSATPLLEQYYPDTWPIGMTAAIPPGGGATAGTSVPEDAWEDAVYFFINNTPPPDFTNVLQEIATPFGPYGVGAIETETFQDSADGDPPTDRWSYQAFFWLPRLGFVPVPVVLTTPSKIRGVMFRSDPRLLEYAGPLNEPDGIVAGTNNAWGRPDAPGPYNAPIIGDGPLLVSGDDGGDPDMDNMRFIGVVTLDRRTGGISFQPA